MAEGGTRSTGEAGPTGARGVTVAGEVVREVEVLKQATERDRPGN